MDDQVGVTSSTATRDLNFLERFFKLSSHNTNVRTELMAGLTTFVTMSYIMFLNPIIMSKTGMPFDGLFLATCLGAAIATIMTVSYTHLTLPTICSV